MPIYAYRCEACGFSKDVLQKISDAPLTKCPSCAADAFKKQLTAAGFQLKGTGWYVTDFRNKAPNVNNATTAKKAETPATETSTSTSTPNSTSTTANTESASKSAPAATSSKNESKNA